MKNFLANMRTSALALALAALTGGSAVAQSDGSLLIGAASGNTMKLGTIGGTGMVSVTNGANSISLDLSQIGDLTLLGNNSGVSAVPSALSASAVKTLLSLNNVENTQLSTWTGSSNITTVGTITTGTWNGTAIALNKLAALAGGDKALVSDNSGYVSESAVTATELGYLSGVTSAIQTQLGNKANNTVTISTTAPLSGGGDLSANRTLSIADAAADGTTKGAATFTDFDFNAASGVISIDYTNGQEAGGSSKGFLTAADWTTFNDKQSTSLADGTVWVGNALNVATSVSLSGDVSMINDGTVTIANNAVTNAKIDDGAVTTAKIASGAVTTAEIADATIANADISTLAAIALSKLATVTADKALVSDASGFVSASSVTATELGHVSGVTSGIQSQLNSKQSTALANGKVWVGDVSGVATEVALSGDVTMDNTGATTIGASKVTNGMLAGSIADSKLSTISSAGKVANSATTATDANTVSTIVLRDASGNFSAGTITATLSGNATNVTGTVAIANGGTGATDATGAMTNLLPTQTGNNGKVLTTDGSGNLSWTSPGAASVAFSGIQDGTSTGKTLTVGNTSTLRPTGTGVIEANEFNGSGSTSSAVDLATAEVSGTLGLNKGGTNATTASDARTNLGLAIGTDVQAYDADLSTIAGLTSVANLTSLANLTGAADKGIQFTAANTLATYDLTSAGKALLDDATAADQRTTLGLGDMAVQNKTAVDITGGTAVGLTNVRSSAIGSNTTLKLYSTNKSGSGTDVNEQILMAPVTVSGTDYGFVGIGEAAPTRRLALPNLANNAGFAISRSWQTYSSRKWKENVRPIESAMDKVNKLQGVRYTWKKEFGGNEDIGFIIEEVDKVLPEVVSYGADGNTPGMDYARINAVLVEALKEEHAKTEALAKDVAELKALVSALVSNTKPSTSEDVPTVGSGSVIEVSPAILGQNVPNPFEGVTTIPYFVPKSVNVAELVISDNASNQLRRIVLGDRGVQSKITLSMSEFTSGVYQYALVVDGKIVDTKSMTMVR